MYKYNKNTFQVAFVSKICLIYQQMTFCIGFWTGCGNVLSWQVSSILSMYSMFERTLRHNEYGFVTQVHVIQLSGRSQLLCRQKKKNYDALHVVLSIKQNIGGPWEIIKSDKKLAYLAKIICLISKEDWCIWVFKWPFKLPS